MNSKSILLTRSEMLAEFGIADSTERKLRGTPGWMPHLEIGSRVHYRRAAVERWIHDREVRNVSAASDS